MDAFILIALFTLLWLVIIYHHLAYPIILKKLSSNRDIAEESPDPQYSSDLRTMCIFIPAYNEAAFIADKIRNIALLDYPTEKLSVVVACDGCQDRTAEIANQTLQEPEVAHLNLRIVEFKKNRGKIAILNQLIPMLESEIIALSDTSALISMDALKLANEHFLHDETGFVAASYQILKPGSTGEKKYWQYQRQVKLGEATLGSPIGVHGALYFIRQALFEPLETDTINDDFMIPMRIIKRGYHGRYDTRLISVELEQASLNMDQNRRTRIGAGNLQQVVRLFSMLHPKFGGTAFSFFSGKALRGIMPLILVSQLLLNLLLAFQFTEFCVLFILQLLGITLARISLHWPKGGLPQQRMFTPLKLAFYLINGYFSSLLGCFNYLSGRTKSHWTSVSSD